MPAFDEFRDGGGNDATLAVAPGPFKLRELRKVWPWLSFGPVQVRLVRYRVGGGRSTNGISLGSGNCAEIFSPFNL